jgi:hypothetical protein
VRRPVFRNSHPLYVSCMQNSCRSRGENYWCTWDASPGGGDTSGGARWLFRLLQPFVRMPDSDVDAVCLELDISEWMERLRAAVRGLEGHPSAEGLRLHFLRSADGVLTHNLRVIAQLRKRSSRRVTPFTSEPNLGRLSVKASGEIKPVLAGEFPERLTNGRLA